MRDKFIIILVILFFCFPKLVVADDYGTGVKTTLILKTTKTTGDYPAKYLDTEKPEITVVKVEISPGAGTEWHSHPVPLYAYLLEGSLTVEAQGGTIYHFKAGDAIVELVDIPHRGKNSGTTPAVLIVFYTGEIDTPNSVMTPADQ